MSRSSHAVFALTHSNIAQIMSDLWCKQEDSRSRCCWEGRFSGSCRSVHRAGSSGTAGRSGRRWAHTPGSGPPAPASGVKHTLFQPVLERDENTGFGGVKSNRHSTAGISPQSGAGALQVPSLRQTAERKPRNWKPGLQRNVTRAPE